MIACLACAVPAVAQDVTPPLVRQPQVERWNKALLVASFGLHVADQEITLAALGTGDAREVHPLFNLIGDSPTAFRLFKTGIAAAAHLVFWQLQKYHPRFSRVLIVAETALMGLVVTHNTRVWQASR